MKSGSSHLAPTRRVRFVGLRDARQLGQRALLVAEDLYLQRSRHGPRDAGGCLEEIPVVHADGKRAAPDVHVATQVGEPRRDPQGAVGRDDHLTVQHELEVRQAFEDVLAGLVGAEMEGRGVRHRPQAGDLAQVVDHFPRHLVGERAVVLGGVFGHAERHDQDVGAAGLGRHGRGRLESRPEEQGGHQQGDRDQRQGQSPRASGRLVRTSGHRRRRRCRFRRGFRCGRRRRHRLDGDAGDGVRDLHDRRDELVAAATDGLNRSLQFAAVAERLAGGTDVIAEGGVGDLAPVPDRLEQLLARQHPVAMADQVHEQVEHLGLNGDRHVPVDDPVAGRIDDVFADPELPAIRRTHSKTLWTAMVTESLARH